MIHQDCNRHIHTPITFNFGLFQQFKLRRILTGQYLARVVAFQNDILILLSHIQVCNQHNAPQTADTVTRTASCPIPVAISSGLYPTHALHQATVQNHHAPRPDPMAAQPQSDTPLSTVLLTDDDKH